MFEGYYKGEQNKKLILSNKLYYVRSDGRKGSIFKEDCSIIPKYLLLHHIDNAELYELENEEPILADASYLKTLGFDISGDSYLCFRLKDSSPCKGIKDICLKCKNIYSPYFSTIKKIIV